ncbi:hypothetical protein GNE10_27165 [Nostoc sp. 2RC]|nr:hypothetical protein [Nostoc sp. 2RC]
MLTVNQVFCKPLTGTVIAIAHDHKTEPAQLEFRYSLKGRKLKIELSVI